MCSAGIVVREWLTPAAVMSRPDVFVPLGRVSSTVLTPSRSRRPRMIGMPHSSAADRVVSVADRAVRVRAMISSFSRSVAIKFLVCVARNDMCLSQLVHPRVDPVRRTQHGAQFGNPPRCFPHE